MSTKNVNDTLKYDSRLLELNLKNGVLTKDEWGKYLSQLEDCAHLAEKLNLDDNRRKVDFDIEH